MRFIWVLGLLCLPAFLMADQVVGPVTPPPPAPAAAKPSDSRYAAEEPDYNVEQREAWLKACEKYKAKDQEAYRKCFQEEKSKAKENLRRSFDEVERRQSLPMKNVNPLIEEQERRNNSADEE